MRCQENDSDRIAAFVVKVGADTPIAVPEYHSMVTTDGAFCSWVPVEAGHKLTVEGFFAGTSTEVQFDLIVDGILRNTFATTNKAGSLTKARKKAVKFETGFYSENVAGTTKIETFEADMIVRDLSTNAYPALHCPNHDTVGKIEIQVSIRRDDNEEKHPLNPNTSIKDFSSPAFWKDLFQFPMYTQVRPTQETDFVQLPESQQPSKAKLGKIKRLAKAARVGAQPWAIFRFFYRRQALINDEAFTRTPTNHVFNFNAPPIEVKIIAMSGPAATPSEKAESEIPDLPSRAVTEDPSHVVPTTEVGITGPLTFIAEAPTSTTITATQPSQQNIEQEPHVALIEPLMPRDSISPIRRYPTVEIGTTKAEQVARIANMTLSLPKPVTPEPENHLAAPTAPPTPEATSIKPKDTQPPGLGTPAYEKLKAIMKLKSPASTLNLASINSTQAVGINSDVKNTLEGEVKRANENATAGMDLGSVIERPGAVVNTKSGANDSHEIEITKEVNVASYLRANDTNTLKRSSTPVEVSLANKKLKTDIEAATKALAERRPLLAARRKKRQDTEDAANAAGKARLAALEKELAHLDSEFEEEDELELQAQAAREESEAAMVALSFKASAF